MKYLLNDDYFFCGWEGLPYAVCNEITKDVEFLNKEQFSLLWKCDGYTDIDIESFSEADREGIENLVKKGMISQVEGTGRLKVHTYKKYPCRYRSEVQLSLTGKCNYRCRHCFQSAPHGVLGQQTTHEILSELDQLVECGVMKVSLTGGEPLIHPGFWEIVDGINERGLIITTIYSNGALVDQALVDGLIARDIKPSWSISFDGIGCHDEMRGVPGAEKMAIDAIKLLTDNGFSVGCGYTLTRKSIKVFRESMKFLASIGVHSVKSGDTMPQGEWLDHPEEWLTDEEYLEFYKTYIPQYIEDGRPINLQFEGLFEGSSGEDGKYGFMAEREIQEENLSKLLSCQVLATAFYIGPTGRVLPCMSMDGTSVGDKFDTLWEKPLKEILSKGSHFIKATSVTMADVFDHNKEECANCEQRTHCGSGCRASAIGANGEDYLSLDQRTCMVCKENWAAKIKEVINNG